MLSPEVALRVHAREEMGIDPGELPSPVAAAAISLVCFLFGALLPVIPWFTGATGFAPAAISVSMSLWPLAGRTRRWSLPWSPALLFRLSRRGEMEIPRALASSSDRSDGGRVGEAAGEDWSVRTQRMSPEEIKAATGAAAMTTAATAAATGAPPKAARKFRRSTNLSDVARTSCAC